MSAHETTRVRYHGQTVEAQVMRRLRSRKGDVLLVRVWKPEPGIDWVEFSVIASEAT
jgi:hypothetical protein